MGLAREDERNSTEVENAADIDVEMLPLYHETEHAQIEAAEPLKLPDTNARAAEVRDWLLQTLSNRGLPENRARDLAAQWTTGTGRELRDYPIHIYRQIFGPKDEEVWAVLMAVQAQKEREEIAKQPPRWVSWLVTLSLLLPTVVFGWIAYKVETTLFAVGAGLVAFFCGFACLVCFVVACQTNGDPEQKASDWLTKNWPNPDKPVQAGPSES